MEIKKERKCRWFWRKRKRLKRKVGLGAVPASGREGNIMIEKNAISLYSPWAVCTLTLSFNEWIFLCVYLSMVELSPLPDTQSVTERQRCSVDVSADKISSAVSKQVHRNMTDNRSFINAGSSTFPVFSLVCVKSLLTSSSLPCLLFFSYSLSPSPPFCCLRTSNPGSCVNDCAFQYYSLFRAPRLYLFFFPSPLCGPSACFLCTCSCFGWEYYHSFGIAPRIPNRLLYVNCKLRRNLSWLNFTRKIDVSCIIFLGRQLIQINTKITVPCNVSTHTVSLLSHLESKWLRLCTTGFNLAIWLKLQCVFTKGFNFN